MCSEFGMDGVIVCLELMDCLRINFLLCGLAKRTAQYSLGCLWAARIGSRNGLSGTKIDCALCAFSAEPKRENK